VCVVRVFAEAVLQWCLPMFVFYLPLSRSPFALQATKPQVPAPGPGVCKALKGHSTPTTGVTLPLWASPSRGEEVPLQEQPEQRESCGTTTRSRSKVTIVMLPGGPMRANTSTIGQQARACRTRKKPPILV
jgi:hypothetical protein